MHNCVLSYDINVVNVASNSSVHISCHVHNNNNNNAYCSDIPYCARSVICIIMFFQDVMEEWAICQKSWLYLEPIFSSDDIMRQLPVEGKRYQTMDRMWRKVMLAAKQDPKVSRLIINYFYDVLPIELKEKRRVLIHFGHVCIHTRYLSRYYSYF